jgi:hypothetical protein
MRSISLLIATVILACCTTAAAPPGPAMRSASGERAYQTLIANKVAGAPMNCLPTYHQNDMSIIDGRNVVFRTGTRTAYLVRLTPGCELLGSGNYALLSRQFGGTQLCHGDIQQVIDIQNRITVGSCTVADIVPYTRP